jgi:hypothetical protein
VVAKPVALAIPDTVDDYLASVKATTPSPRTMEYYESILVKVFLPWCSDEHVTVFEQLDQCHLDRLNPALLTRRKADGSVSQPARAQSYRRAVRQMLSWAKKSKRWHRRRSASSSPRSRRRRSSTPPSPL